MKYSQEDICAKLKKEIIEKLKLDIDAERLTYDQEFFDGGLELDSLDIIEITSTAEDMFGITITSDDEKSIKCIRDLANLIITKIN
ncbi:acyl carrier protein [Clostridium hydrogenum]|uniref:acyl carrier protein n=1 Tax=Clostridium hydrogenum TaxID=2855764 RepID=UPI001F182A2E|nr:phosphopantetheine-binding protein [Clostridium hydrogenum]